MRLHGIYPWLLHIYLAFAVMLNHKGSLWSATWFLESAPHSAHGFPCTDARCSAVGHAPDGRSQLEALL